jgi:hypothetical protein
VAVTRPLFGAGRLSAPDVAEANARFISMLRQGQDNLAMASHGQSQHHLNTCRLGSACSDYNHAAIPTSSYASHRAALIAYLRHKVDAADWHGVSDAANDLRVLEAAHACV